MQMQEADPKGLVRESYRIDGISAAECRSIFLDWALSVPLTTQIPDALRALIAQYAGLHPGHPMNQVLIDALPPAAPPHRRGGRAARLGYSPRTG